ncbi:uncharacterized protein LOC112683230 [Sipha flava]|uniref:Uncharacterized protein LOC112683230 n=1 Tax=Sipha flava TaxID=143950 RepID=A0A8B8FHB4_9HEMI|nr:uncharacterized protein LOC112683230 [Sipha flava]
MSIEMDSGNIGFLDDGTISDIDILNSESENELEDLLNKFANDDFSSELDNEMLANTELDLHEEDDQTTNETQSGNEVFDISPMQFLFVKKKDIKWINKPFQEPNRFYSIRQNIHIINNMDIARDNTDKFVKIRPLFDALNNRCKQLPVERNISVDEQIVPFKGQLVIKQYMKGKPNPWGIKIFLLCGQSGIVYNSGSQPPVRDKRDAGPYCVVI